MNKNKELLEKVKDNVWQQARKSASVWVKAINENMMIETLEGEVEGKVGQFLCKGSAGELWPQDKKKFYSKYIFDNDVDDEGFEKFISRPDSPVVFVTQPDFEFEVHTSWAELKGKPNDYLVKSEDTNCPEDIWIVDKKVFESTYKIVEDVQAQGMFDLMKDAYKIFSKENIDKVNKILDSISIEKLDNGATRISIDVFS